MATQPTSSPSAAPSLIDGWVPYLQQIGYGMLAVGGGLAILTLVLGYNDQTNRILLGWGLLAAVTLMAGGAFCLIPDLAPGMTKGDFLRLLLLVVLSVNGLAASVAGLLLPFVQYREQLGGDLQAWRQQSGILSLCIGAFVGGLVLLFLGLSLGRSYERSQPELRRLLYGYNAVFSSLLLGLILIILNVLAYSPVWPFTYLNGQPIDWTKAGLYSLKKDSKDLLVKVKEPVTLKIILPTQHPLFQNVVDLAKNCRTVNPLITYETLSPQISDPEIRKLKEKYNLQDPTGIIVVYGTEPSTKFRHIPPDDLIKRYTDQFGQPTGGIYYTTEQAVMKAIRQLAFESKSLKIFFTQGNGEMTLEGRRNPLFMLSSLRTRLDPDLFNVQQVPFTGADAAKAIPLDDKDRPDIVVIAGPTEHFSDEALKALKDYLAKNGKLIVLLGSTPPNRRDEMKKTGLEELLKSYNVDVGDNRVLYARKVALPGQVGAIMNAAALRVQVNEQSNNPIVAVFKDEQKEFLFLQARSIGKSEGTSGAASYQVDELIQTIPANGAWADRNFAQDADQLAKALRENPEQFSATVSKKPISLAVAVSEGQKPHMVVMGSAWFLSDALGELNYSDNNYELFRASLAWLADRPEIGNMPIDDKPPQYTLTANEDRVTLMERLPAVLMLLGVLTLGGGVWVVRRR